MLPGDQHLRRHAFVAEPGADILIERPLSRQGALQFGCTLAGHPSRGVVVEGDRGRAEELAVALPQGARIEIAHADEVVVRSFNDLVAPTLAFGCADQHGEPPLPNEGSLWLTLSCRRAAAHGRSRS